MFYILRALIIFMLRALVVFILAMLRELIIYTLILVFILRASVVFILEASVLILKVKTREYNPLFSAVNSSLISVATEFITFLSFYIILLYIMFFIYF